MALVASPPRSVVLTDERRHLPDEPVRGRDRELGDERPVVAEPAHRPSVRPLPCPLEVAQVDREHAARPKRAPDRSQRALDRIEVRQVVEGMADTDDRVRLRHGIVRQRQPADVCARRRLAGQVEHRRRGVRRDDPVARVYEVLREEAAATADLEHEPIPLADWLQEAEDPRRAHVGVEAESEVVYEGEVSPVVRVVHRLRSRRPAAPTPARPRRSGGRHRSRPRAMRTSPVPTQTTSFSHR